MQAILVINVSDFFGLIQRTGIDIAVDMVYELRNVVSARLGARIVSMCQDTIIATLPSVSEAMDEAKRIMGTLCSQNSLGHTTTDREEFACILTRAAIGFGDLFQTVDGSYWGLEMLNALRLVDDASQSQILLTDAARGQLPSVVQDVCDL